jgi:precorrin-6Y C5,15-methyltransferase (decarboxylating)
MAGKLVYIIGAGPGSPKFLTGEAREAFAGAECLIGAERLLASLDGVAGGKERVAAVSEDAVVRAIKNSAYGVYAVAVSGDSGFFSLARRLLPRLQAEGWEARVLCGLSSVSYFASRLGVPYDGATLASLHGKLPSASGGMERERLLNRLAGIAAASDRSFFLTDDVTPPGVICRTLTERGLGSLRISVGERLSYPDEHISVFEARDVPDREFDTPNAVCIENDAVAARRVPPTDSELVLGGVPFTKEEVRAVSLARLRLEPDSVVWDVGAGTGAMSCAMAFSVPYGRVYAVEKDEEALSLLRRNRQKFACYNLKITAGEAPAALSSLPPPDSVFIGGSGGALQGIIREIGDKNPRARVVINAITLETLEEARTVIAESGFFNAEGAEITQIGVSRARKAGRYSLLTAQNPVFVISVGGPE